MPLSKRTSELPRQEDLQAFLARIEELTIGDEFHHALSLAQSNVIEFDDPVIHNRLVQLRIMAAAKTSQQARPRADWPPKLSDPFPGCIGIPEIEGAALEANLMGGAILHHGSLIVRGLLGENEAECLARDVDCVFEAYDLWARQPEMVGGWLSPIEVAEHDALLKTRTWQRAEGAIFAADSPPFLNRLAELYARTGVLAAITDYLGERPVLSVGKTVLRRVEPTGVRDFHQDGAFLGRDVRTVNVWIALSDCGVDAPGLEIVDRRLPGIVATGTGDAQFDWSVGREVAREANEGRPFARPVFAPGDAILFDQLMLHATGFAPTMTKTRWAIESWFFAPSAYSMEQIPMLL